MPRDAYAAAGIRPPDNVLHLDAACWKWWTSLHASQRERIVNPSDGAVRSVVPIITAAEMKRSRAKLVKQTMKLLKAAGH